MPPTTAHSLDLDRINPVYAALLRVFGPPDSPDNPLLGTKYDSRLAAQREREKVAQRRIRADARWQRWDERLHGHNPVPPRFGTPGSVGRGGSEPGASPDRERPD